MGQSNLRIVSLLSSATEIACELGLEKNLVGISHECDYPLSIRSLPIASEIKINPALPSASIHNSVLERVEKGLSIYRVKPEILEELKPDIILTQHQCEVCAVSPKDLEEAVRSLTKKDTVVCSLSAFALDDICKDFRKVGAVTGREKEAEDLVTRFWIRLNQVNAKTGTHLKVRPKVLALEWLDPPIIAGSWIPEMITLAGGDPMIVDGPKPFKKVSWEELHEQQPDKILIFPCGWSIERTLEEMKLPQIKEKLEAWPAFKSVPVAVCDGNQYFNRPGPRIADSLEILGAALWPEKFPTKRYGFTFVTNLASS
ncbi:MAG: cobalamin-binding protein [Proteobacteria bacterium]|nr:cobalamin-binding protein [Pseudomonadota bacterium]